MLRLLYRIGLVAALWSAPLQAQDAVTSAGPDAVEVSLYRDSGRAPDDAIDRNWPEGFALVSETRLVTLPPGPTTIRFEGVASGIDPASALVRGVGVEEKNQDANLLSERGLLDHFTGQSVTVRRFNQASGKYIEEPALIRSGASSVVLETVAGFEALRCTGLAQTLVFDRVPQSLSPKPTLSVKVADQPGGQYNVTLTYLADRFDWQANYVAELNADASAMALRGWMTLVSADTTSFVAADTNAIAGQVFRSTGGENERLARARRRQSVSYNCWPIGTTGAFRGYNAPEPPRLFSPPPPPPAMSVDAIVVTGTRIARREDLGDLKLYRIPFPTTVAANSQKQVAFLDKQEVKGELIYRVEIQRASVTEIKRIFRVENTPENGVGEPLPSGQVAFFQRALGYRQLVGEGATRDKAVGEVIEFALGGADNVTAETDYSGTSGEDWQEIVIILRNANPAAVTVEAEFAEDEAGAARHRFAQRTFERDGKRVWRVLLPANAAAEFRYRLYNGSGESTASAEQEQTE